jgi:hypothetical protein
MDNLALKYASCVVKNQVVIKISQHEFRKKWVTNQQSFHSFNFDQITTATVTDAWY